jgi:uncharacterized protein
MTPPVKSATAIELSAQAVVNATQRWLERAVIGLNLCPFAKQVWLSERVRLVVYPGEHEQEALEWLGQEISHLAQQQGVLKTEPPVAFPSSAETPSALKAQTTLLILPKLCGDFWDFLSLVQAAQRVLKAKRLVGEIQIAHFHPLYQFSHTQADDPENYTNRSPYPVLHLLLERDVEWAASHHPDVSQIYQDNVQRLNELGHEGWQELARSWQVKSL